MQYDQILIFQSTDDRQQLEIQYHSCEACEKQLFEPLAKEERESQCISVVQSLGSWQAQLPQCMPLGIEYKEVFSTVESQIQQLSAMCPGLDPHQPQGVVSK